MRRILFALLFLICLGPISNAAELADSCEDKLNEQWIGMLEDLKRAETLFMESRWQYLKYWETVYNPLWQAQVKKDDQLSETRKAEGEVLFIRYERLAEDYLSLAEEADSGLVERLAGIRGKLKKIPGCCNVHDYRQCMTARSHDILERTENLEKILSLRKTVEVEFSARVRAAVNERPSDHDEFSERYLSYLQELEVLGTGKILRLLRDLRESLELNWPGQKCCELCKAGSGDPLDDPLLNRLRPNKQGQTGVDGRMVNNASLLKAFEEFEESKKKKPEFLKRPADQTKS